MIHELNSRKFNNQYNAKAVPTADDYVFIYDKNEDGKLSVLVRTSENGIDIPKLKDVMPDVLFTGVTESISEDLTYLFSISDIAYECNDSATELNESIGECENHFFLAENAFVGYYDRENAALAGFGLESPRIFREDRPRDMCMAGATANHLQNWYSSNRFCGKCGARMEHDVKLRMMHCHECGNMVFPRLNPAVTIALRNGDSLMVSRYANRPGSTGMALLAGFVEIGETLEECVAREVMEEVGMKAVNIEYFGSQPWGFAGNIQIGFFADVEGSTEVILDEEELASARFISRDEIPENPDGLSLTQAMIEAFRLGKY